MEKNQLENILTKLVTLLSIRSIAFNLETSLLTQKQSYFLNTNLFAFNQYDISKLVQMFPSQFRYFQVNYYQPVASVSTQRKSEVTVPHHSTTSGPFKDHPEIIQKYGIIALDNLVF